MSKVRKSSPGKAQADYVWRFPLSPADERTNDADPFVEMVRLFLRDFLNLGFLTRAGSRVEVDGFVFLQDAETIHVIFDPGSSSPKRGEPI